MYKIKFLSLKDKTIHRRECGWVIRHIMSLLTLTLATCLLVPGHVWGAWPVVTWHGAGGTASECDQMIETIR